MEGRNSAIVILGILLVSGALATDLQNIEEIQPYTSGTINITGNLDLKTNKIQNPSEVDGIDLDDPGEGIKIQSSKLRADYSDLNMQYVNRLSADQRFGYLNMTGNEIRGLADPTDPQDAATRSWVNTNDDTKPGTDEFGNADDLDAQGDVTGLSDFTVEDDDVSEDAFQDEYLDENSGDTMGGDLSMGDNSITNIQSITSDGSRSQPNIVLHSTSNNDNWNDQGAYISVGESGSLGSAALHMTYRGDGKSFIGSGDVSNAVPQDSYFRFNYNSDQIYSPDNVEVGTIDTGNGNYEIGQNLRTTDSVTFNGITSNSNVNIGDNSLSFSDTSITEQSGNHLLLQGRDPDQQLRLTDGGSLIYEEYYDGENVFEVDSGSSSDASVRIGEQGGTVPLDMNNNNINNIGGLQNCGNNQFVDGNGNCETDDDKPGNNDFGNADDLDNQGNINDFSAASDLNQNGDITSFDNANNLDSSGTIKYIENGDGSLQVGTTSNGRLWMAPRQNGNSQFSQEFGFNNATDRWYVETDLDLNGKEIVDLSDPTDPQDAATRSWVNTNDDFEADTNANTECSNSQSIYLDGAGDCQDLSTNTASYINGDLLTDSLDETEIQAQTIAGDDLGGNDDTINLATNVDVDTIDFGEGRIISTQGSASGVEMDFEGTDNTLDFRDHQNDGEVWLQIQNDGPVVTPDTNLNLGGNDINNIGGLQNCGNNQFVDGNGNCETDDDQPDNDAEVPDAITVSSSGSVEIGSLTDTGTLSYDWEDSEVLDSITVGASGNVQAEAIDQEGASNGQVLEWDGNNWQPGTDNVQDGDTDNTNELQDLEDVRSRDNTVSGAIDFNAQTNANPPTNAIKNTGYVALTNQEDQNLPNNNQFTLFADHSEGLQYNDNNGNDKIIASQNYVNNNDDNTQNPINGDLVAGNGLTGGQNKVLPGGNTDVTLSLNADDLDAQGNINDFSAADDLDSNGNIGFIDSDDDSQMAFDIDSSAVEMRVHDNSGEFRLVPYNTSNGNWLWSSRFDYDAQQQRWRSRADFEIEGNLQGSNIVNAGNINSGAVTSNEIAGSVAGSGINGGGGSALSVDWTAANDLGSGGTINDFSAASDLNSNGDISDFGDASDLDSAGDISSFDNANDLDAAGDVSSLSDVNTDSLSEGSSNQYHTNERAQDAVGTIMDGSGATTVTYNDNGNSITISSTDNIDDDVNNGELDNLFSGSGILTLTGSGTYTTTTDDVDDNVESSELSTSNELTFSSNTLNVDESNVNINNLQNSGSFDADQVDNHDIGEICESDGTDCPTDNVQDGDTDNTNELQDLEDVRSRNNTVNGDIDMNGSSIKGVSGLEPQGIEGDANGDGTINGKDIEYLYNNYDGPKNCPKSRCDVSDNGQVDVVDVYSLYSSIKDPVNSNLPRESIPFLSTNGQLIYNFDLRENLVAQTDIDMDGNNNILDSEDDTVNINASLHINDSLDMNGSSIKGVSGLVAQNLEGDTNGDGTINGKDLQYLYTNRNDLSKCPKSRCDINDDQLVTVLDFVSLSTSLQNPKNSGLDKESRPFLSTNGQLLYNLYRNSNLVAQTDLDMRGNRNILDSSDDTVNINASLHINDSLDMNGSSIKRVSGLEPQGIEGDTNGDGTINGKDLQYLYQNKDDLSKCPKSRCDINDDQLVTVLDFVSLSTSLQNPKNSGLDKESRPFLSTNGQLLYNLYRNSNLVAQTDLDMRGNRNILDSSDDTVNVNDSLRVKQTLSRGGLWSSYLSSTQSNAENGKSVNVFENVNVGGSSTAYNKKSDSTLEALRQGVYKISYQVNVRRTGSGRRNVMQSFVRVNGNNQIDKTATACYIRNNGDGDECTNSATVMLNLNSGDEIDIFTREERGGESGNNIEHARINIEFVQ